MYVWGSISDGWLAAWAFGECDLLCFYTLWRHPSNFLELHIAVNGADGPGLWRKLGAQSKQG